MIAPLVAIGAMLIWTFAAMTIAEGFWTWVWIVVAAVVIGMIWEAWEVVQEHKWH
jgi:hypothetical protein